MESTHVSFAIWSVPLLLRCRLAIGPGGDAELFVTYTASSLGPSIEETSADVRLKWKSGRVLG